jgi:hypothetical protein
MDRREPVYSFQSAAEMYRQIVLDLSKQNFRNQVLNFKKQILNLTYHMFRSPAVLHE